MSANAARRAKEVVEIIKGQEPARLEIKSQNLIHVLLVDDYPEFTDPLKEQLERWGYSVDVAADPEQGNSFLARKNYQIIIADMKFPEQFISGDEFLLQNKEAVQKATTIAITANKANITYESELKQLRVIIIEKGQHIAELREITTRTLEEVAHQINNAAVSIISGQQVTGAQVSPVSSESDERMKGILIKWLVAMGEPNKKSILYKGKMYSPQDLVSEVEAGSPVGHAHMEMMINLFEDTFTTEA